MRGKAKSVLQVSSCIVASRPARESPCPAPDGAAPRPDVRGVPIVHGNGCIIAPAPAYGIDSGQGRYARRAAGRRPAGNRQPAERNRPRPAGALAVPPRAADHAAPGRTSKGAVTTPGGTPSRTPRARRAHPLAPTKRRLAAPLGAHPDRSRSPRRSTAQTPRTRPAAGPNPRRRGRCAGTPARRPTLHWRIVPPRPARRRWTLPRRAAQAPRLCRRTDGARKPRNRCRIFRRGARGSGARRSARAASGVDASG